MIELNHYYRLRKRARALRLATTLIVGAFIFVFFAGSIHFFKGPVALLHIGFWFIVIASALTIVRAQRFSYAFGEKSMVVRCGAVFSGHDVIPYHHIESVYATPAWVGKFFGLCFLHIHVPRSQGLRVSGDGGEAVLLCAGRRSDELIFLVVRQDAHDIICLVRARIKRHRQGIRNAP